MKRKNIIIATMLIMIMATTNIMASEINESETNELRLEDAIEEAQSRDSRIKNQSKNIEYAKYDKEEAYNNYNNSWDMPVGFEKLSVNYSLKLKKAKYEKKIVPVLEDQVAYEVSNLFDEILDKEDQLSLANDLLEVQKTKLNHEIRKIELGAASQDSVNVEKAALESQEKEINTLEVSIDAEYRKLNDKINGKSPRYNLIKELKYEPLEMERSMPGQINHAVNSDPNIWLQEESAVEQERLIITTETGFAPTYSEYQKKKIAYKQGLDDVKQAKDMKEEQVKNIYENINTLEAQRLQLEVELEEAIRKNEILEIQRDLGFVTGLQAKEASLGIRQLEVQLNNITRNHNKLKEIFEKPHLQSGQMQPE